MPITPIEIATMVPKSQEASMMKQGEQTKAAQNQASLNSQFQQDIRHNSQQTVKATESEYPDYRYDAKEKGNNSYQNKGQKKKKQSKEEPEEKSGMTKGHFDIRI